MPIGSGLSAQLGLGVETTYGTFATPTRFHEFTSESLKAKVGKSRTRSMGDRFQRKSRVRTYEQGAEGSIELEVLTKGFGLLLKHMLGAATSVQVGATAEWTHTCQPDTNGGAGNMLTAQVGRPDVGGTVRPFNYLGGKVTGWELAAALDENVKLKVDLDFQSSQTSSPLAVQSLPADAIPLCFIDGAMTLDGTTVAIKSIKIAGKPALDTERRFIGAATTKKEPIANGEYEITGEFQMEFEDLAQYAKYIAGTTGKIVLTFAHGTIPTTSNPFKLVTTLEVIEYDGDATPNVSSSGVLMQTLPFKALYDGTNPIVKMVYHTSDTTI